MECTTASAPVREELYVEGFRMSALFQVTDLDHRGGSAEEVTEDQVGSPERLRGRLDNIANYSLSIDLT